MNKAKKLIYVLISLILCCVSLAACGSKNSFVLTTDDVINAQYDGVGFEWDLYETAPMITKEQWDKTLERVDFIQPGVVRVMFDLGRFLKGFVHNSDKTFTPVYQWDNVYMNNLYDILDYCQQKNIKVFTGMWQASRTFTYTDEGVTKYIIEDEGGEYYIKAVCDMLEHLVGKGYSCVKGLIPYNEPNYTANRPDRWDTFLRCANGFYYEFAARGLDQKIQILGPDTSGLTDSPTWFNDCVSHLEGKLDAYEMHAYINDYMIKNRLFEERLKNLKFDNLNQTTKKFYIFEAGLQDGRNNSNRGHDRIESFDYANILTDYFIQTLYGGVDAIAFWSLDSAMHLNSQGEHIEFAMFNSQNPDTSKLRPFYHAVSLMSKIFSSGSKVYGKSIDDLSLRFAGAVSSDLKTAGVTLYNRSEQAKSEFIQFKGDYEAGDNMYVYVMSEDKLSFNKSGFILPTYSLNGSLKNGAVIEIPSDTAVFVTNKIL